MINRQYEERSPSCCVTHRWIRTAWPDGKLQLRSTFPIPYYGTCFKTLCDRPFVPRPLQFVEAIPESLGLRNSTPCQPSLSMCDHYTYHRGDTPDSLYVIAPCYLERSGLTSPCLSATNSLPNSSPTSLNSCLRQSPSRRCHHHHPRPPNTPPPPPPSITPLPHTRALPVNGSRRTIPFSFAAPPSPQTPSLPVPISATPTISAATKRSSFTATGAIAKFRPCNGGA